MGVIIGTRVTKENKIICEVEVNYEEFLRLKGHVKKIHLFSEDTAEIKANLSQRGTNEATKYFLIPRELREDLTFKENVKCQKIETGLKTLFFFVVERINTNSSTGIKK